MKKIIGSDLLENIKSYDTYATAYCLIYYLRRIFICLVAVYLRDYPGIQIQVITLSNSFILISKELVLPIYLFFGVKPNRGVGLALYWCVIFKLANGTELEFL